MQDKVYQSVKWIAVGILIGYFGKYALAWTKTKLARKKESLASEEELDEY